MKYESFSALYQRAAERKGGEAALESLLPRPLSVSELAALGDDRYLSALSMKVFQSGFVWRVVRNKWPDFEDIFWSFDIDKLLLMPEDMLERKSQDPRIIRNFSKVKTILHNAQMISDVREQHGSFAKFVAEWPSEDITGLWLYLKKHGARLGGNTGPYALRYLGKDTFLLTQDVESYLRANGHIDGGIQTKKSLAAAQDLFNHWQAESGRSLTELSCLVAYGVGDNRVQA